jgi:hypothetical protein
MIWTNMTYGMSLCFFPMFFVIVLTSNTDEHTDTFFPSFIRFDSSLENLGTIDIGLFIIYP